MSPTTIRRRSRTTQGAPEPAEAGLIGASAVRLVLAYRAPLAWDVLLDQLRQDALPGVESIAGMRYARAVRIGNHTGLVSVEPMPDHPLVEVTLSATLLPVLMEILFRLRQVFDLDAEPDVVDHCLARTDLASSVARHRGVRIPGALDGFDAALHLVLEGSGAGGRVTQDLGEPIAGGDEALNRLAPSADRVADAGASRLAALGLSPKRAETLAALARAVADGALRLEPGQEVASTRDALLAIPGVQEPLAAGILLRALHWPDAFPVTGSRELLTRAEQWRPWRGYAALHLRLASS
jgi:AraC family transcriptional regulator of adaptative response / DNA-3-methyladenine glycosylase II